MPSVTTDNTCTCCGAKHCFQLWTAHWSCDDAAWTLTAGAKECVRAVTTDWVRTGDACSFQKYVSLATSCTENSDCSVLGDSDPPELPFGGGPPTACCPCLAECGCRNVGATAAVSFDSVENDAPCTTCGFAFVVRGGTTTLGTYTLSKGTGCSFGAIATGDFLENSTDCDGEFVTGESEANIELGFDVLTGVWSLAVFAEDFQFFYGEVDQGDCSGPLVFENQLTVYDPCGLADPQTFAFMINGTATVVFAPCVPA